MFLLVCKKSSIYKKTKKTKVAKIHHLSETLSPLSSTGCADQAPAADQRSDR